MGQHPHFRYSLLLLLAVLICLIVISLPVGKEAGRWLSMRQLMVEQIKQDTLDTRSYTGLSELSDKVVEAFLKVPRHRFVPDHQQAAAYENRPLPIGHGQTISQPFIVALMTQLLAPLPSDRILEIGTGSGYQAAILAELAAHVYSIEIVKPLANTADQRLRALGYHNVTVKAGDGYHGWPEYAPFDGIIATAAPSSIPPALIKQLKPGGKLVIPVGEHNHIQSLQLMRKTVDGQLHKQELLPVVFVPFTREQAP